MGAYQNASQLLPKPVLAMAREVNYSKENYLILARRNKQLQKEFPQIWENIQGCAYCADGRAPIEYARDLVASWLVEDYFLHLLMEAHKPYGGKPAYVVPCQEDDFFPLSPDDLAKHLQAALLAKTA